MSGSSTSNISGTPTLQTKCLGPHATVAQLEHRQPCFCSVGRFMHNLEPLSSSYMSGLRPGSAWLLFHGQPL